jgi:hypothetical protein
MDTACAHALDRFGSMLLKKSKTTRRQFACCKKSDRRQPNQRGLNHVTEVASEFIFKQ